MKQKKQWPHLLQCEFPKPARDGTCIGPTRKPDSKRSHFIMHSFLTRDARINKAKVGCCDVNSTLQRFWQIESYGTDTKRSAVMTKEEKNALNRVESSLTHNGSRYSIPVPWKEGGPTLPNNREMAKKRLESTVLLRMSMKRQ